MTEPQVAVAAWGSVILQTPAHIYWSEADWFLGEGVFQPGNTLLQIHDVLHEVRCLVFEPIKPR